jgi:hypothetical protein
MTLLCTLRFTLSSQITDYGSFVVFGTPFPSVWGVSRDIIAVQCGFA